MKKTPEIIADASEPAEVVDSIPEAWIESIPAAFVPKSQAPSARVTPNQYDIWAELRVSKRAIMVRLKDISQLMEDVWCLMGDFNSLISKDDRIDHELRELTSLLESCALHEPKSIGANIYWTNRTIWSCIDHYGVFDYTHSCYMTNSLSDRTPLVLQLPSSPKPKATFQYYDMWSKHHEFESIINSPQNFQCTSPMQTLCQYLKLIRPLLRRLNKNYLSDLKEQQTSARKTLE
ncbi:hypothetical protein Cgig2_007814 [Carnegiea gigantea]|uniref:Uncharacterized protein n=1 Tax=Carnegiea gigantea TaxID=171969 RepID=A0A9Q1GM43_9CARY|nr:hypothetical protein Cgig2_007814 [Carnegiea gigantea]